jgi:alkaline phosphatase D
MKAITRRQAISGLAAAPIIAGTTWSAQVNAALKSEKTRSTFLYGIASGDPSHDSIVLWTRINDPEKKQIKVEWELSLDLNFSQIVKSGRIKTNEKRDYSVKVEVKKLEAGRRYFYRFNYQGTYSEPGKTRTLPEGKLDKLGIAIASCSNYPFGHFNAYEAMANDENIDFVLHLGDYIYEYGPDGYGGSVGKTLNREHIPAREIVSLNDYRLRHAQYKSDECSRKLHAAHPLIAIWDDHESTNNPYMEGAQNHQNDEGDWYQRRDVSLQAYYEWMPIKKPKQPEALWRNFVFGDLVSLTTLETRHTGRSQQIDYREHLPKIKNTQDRQKFVKEIMGDSARTMLSEEMTKFLSDSLNENRKLSWRLIGNQIPMARTHVPPIPDEFISDLNIAEDNPIYPEVKAFQKLGQLNLPIYSDTWDGYPAARQKFYETCQAAGAEDLIVLTGDSHAFWFNQLADDFGRAMGFEIGTTGVTSPGDFESFGPKIAATLDEKLARFNQEIQWTDNQSKGYVRLDLSHESVEVHYLAVSDILSRRYEVKRVRQETLHRRGKKIISA